MAPDPDGIVVLRVKRSALEDPAFPLGIVRLSRDRRITFLNRAAREIAGPQVREGDPVSALPIDAGNRAVLEEALSQREREQASTYRLGVFRIDLDHMAYSSISAIPEYDESGAADGSVGFIVEEDLRDATLRIHEAIQRARSSHEVYEALYQELQGVVAFDALMVTGVSKDLNHLQELFQKPAGTPYATPTKWWPMQPFVKRMIDLLEPGNLDLDEMFARPEFIDYAQRDENVRIFKDQGFHHALRIAVKDSGKLRAIISLMRKSTTPFAPADARRCAQLPVSDAGAAAIGLDRERRLKFRLDLVRQISGCSTEFHRVAQLFVDELQAHYDWDHVSLFQADANTNELRLLCQAAAEDRQLPPAYRQPATEGLLGLAFQHDKTVCIGDVKGSILAAAYIEGISGTRSELIMPLSVPGSRLRWLLNVESRLRDAFSDEDQSELKLLLGVAGLIMDRSFTIDLNTKILESVADGVVITTSAGIVLEANPAARRLLGRELAEAGPLRLADLIEVPGDEEDEHVAALAHLAALEGRSVEEVFVQGDWPALNVRIPVPGGGRHHVRLTSARLPGELGGKVFLASDLTGADRARRLEVLSGVLQQLASETRVPLALAATFLSDALQRPQAAEELVASALKQIRKADLPLERVLRVEAAAQADTLPTAVVDLLSSVERACGELPASEAREVRVVSKEERIAAAAAPPELQFCIQGLLSHLLRVRSLQEQVEVTVGRLRRTPYVGFALTGEPGCGHGAAAAGSDDLRLVEPVLEGLMRRMGGDYKRRGSQLARFTLTLPLPKA